MQSGIASSKRLTQSTSSGARLGIQHRSRTLLWLGPARKACPSLGLDTKTPALTYVAGGGVVSIWRCAGTAMKTLAGGVGLEGFEPPTKGL